MLPKKLSLTEKNLTRRYLIWCYKTTKEDLDRVDRYFTQHLADQRLFGILSKNTKQDPGFVKKVEDFRQYMETKQKNAIAKKYLDIPKKIYQPEYGYLKNRLAAIETVITEFLGKKDLAIIRALYEQEMTRRIMEAREHT